MSGLKYIMKNTKLRFFVDTTVAVSEKINYGISYVMECCTVRKNVPKQELVKFDIKDKNDRPIIAGAAHESAFLVTEDSMLLEDAKKYVDCGLPGDALKILQIHK